MNAVVLSCSSLKEYVEDAMKTQNENYDIILIDRSFHTEPARMKEAICKEFKKWDEQFWVAEPGHIIRLADFFNFRPST